MEFFRQRAQCLGQQTHLRNTHGKLAGFGLEQYADRAENVAEVVMLERVMRFLASVIVADEQLNFSAHVLNSGETGFAHYALQHHASGHRDVYLRGFQLVMGLLAEFGMQISGEMFALEIVGKGDAGFAYLGKFVAAFRDDLIGVQLGSGLVGGHGVMPIIPTSDAVPKLSRLRAKYTTGWRFDTLPHQFESHLLSLCI